MISMKEKISNVTLPKYTRGEEKLNTFSHFCGIIFGIAALVLCIRKGMGNALSLICAVFYALSMIAVYTVSTLYHGAKKENPKKMLRILDHCTIYFLIVGTYTPVCLCSLMNVSAFWGFTVFFTVLILGIAAAVFTFADMKKYFPLSMACYIVMGWSILMCIKETVCAMSYKGFMWLLLGGVAYTAGAVLYGIGKKHKYIHSVFHVFILLGSVLQFVSVYFYVL